MLIRYSTKSKEGKVTLNLCEITNNKAEEKVRVKIKDNQPLR